jgi:histidyl-tRNA synthetase
MQNTGDKYELKTPKGTKDYGPLEMAIREKVFETITRVFKLHGAVTIDTPVFELKEVLTGKYGEDSKLIYDLQDQGGELCSLRYDLTVPFARFLAMNKSWKQMKRYHIGKVYRRDQPVITKGRFREFYQCDYDIAGVYEPMVPDAEIFKVMVDLLDSLNVGKFLIKFNHRGLLDGIFEICGVPADKFRAICSAVDKLDKTPWDEVRKEMTEQKGLDPETADKIGGYVKLNGGKDLLEKLQKDTKLNTCPMAKTALEQLATLFKYLEIFQVLDKVSFDLSLARGLDYYTGVIFEAVMTSSEGVGSIIGGGRYDNLVGMFNPSNPIPCVGFSIGVERVFSILEAKIAAASSSGENSLALDTFRANPVDVLVASISSSQEHFEERMRIVNELWKAGIRSEIQYKVKVKLLDSYSYCESRRIPWLVFFGEDELNTGQVRIRNMSNREDKGTLIPRLELVSEIKARLSLNSASGTGSVESCFQKLSL